MKTTRHRIVISLSIGLIAAAFGCAYLVGYRAGLREGWQESLDQQVSVLAKLHQSLLRGNDRAVKDQLESALLVATESYRLLVADNSWTDSSHHQYADRVIAEVKKREAQHRIHRDSWGPITNGTSQTNSP